MHYFYFYERITKIAIKDLVSYFLLSESKSLYKTKLYIKIKLQLSYRNYNVQSRFKAIAMIRRRYLT